MLIRLSDGCYLAADYIAEIRVSEYGERINVKTKDGTTYSHIPTHRGGVYDALDKLVAEVNAALSSNL